MRTHLHSVGWSRQAVVRAGHRDAHAFALDGGGAGVVMRTHLHSVGWSPQAVARAGHRDAHGFALDGGGAGAAMRTHLHSAGRTGRALVRAGHRNAHAFAVGRFALAPEVRAPWAHAVDGPKHARKPHGEQIPKSVGGRKRKGCFYASNVMFRSGGGRPNPVRCFPHGPGEKWSRAYLVLPSPAGETP